eukprot:TRINITY_DN62641_c0_g1_i1.p2 TRINITY_DN62641_c0_g1~~TRINITY_DN62641_c0_g1_i1.p2  ORF type:complete len:131 (-),score=17.70 TRINITY_DN62641_c0_g1_i1:24-389(-)
MSPIDQVEPQHMHHLSALTALTSFCVVNCILDVQGCMALFAMARLRALRLCDSYLAIPQVVCGLADLKDLRLERLEHCHQDDADEFVQEMCLPDTCPGLTALVLPTELRIERGDDGVLRFW